MMNKIELEKVAREKREKFAILIGLEDGSENFKSVVDGPLLCTTKYSTLEEPSPEALIQVKTLEGDETKVIHIIHRQISIYGDIMDIRFYVFQNIGYDEDAEEEYGSIEYGEMGPGEFRVDGYGENLTQDFCSEYGTAGVKCSKGIIIQTM